jgi:hypothetical protein
MTEKENKQEKPDKEEIRQKIFSIVDEVHHYLKKLNIDVEYLHGVSMLSETFYQVERVKLPRKFTEQEMNEIKNFLRGKSSEAYELLWQIEAWQVRHNIEYSLFRSPELIGWILYVLSDPKRVVYK